MKSVDYIIVGDGYAAMFLAHQFIKNKKSFLLFSEQKKSASQVSAGIINPVVLKRFTSFWLAKEQIDCLHKNLTEIEQYTGKNYFIHQPILRIFHDENEKHLWLKKSENPDLKDFLSKKFIHLDHIKNPFGCGKVLHSGRLNVQEFFEDLFEFLNTQNLLISEKFDYKKLNTQTSTYQQIQYKKIIFAEGMLVKENPFFSQIPVHQNKGHHLEVKLSRQDTDSFTLKKKHFLFPLSNTENTFYYGGTYDREQIHQKIDDSAVENLTLALAEFYPDDFEVKNVNFGFRPTVKDRRPIIGAHSQYKNLYVFNGLGARGILNGCYFSEHLYKHLTENLQLHPEVDIQRFA